MTDWLTVNAALRPDYLRNKESPMFLRKISLKFGSASWRISYRQRSSVSKTRIAWARDRFYIFNDEPWHSGNFYVYFKWLANDSFIHKWTGMINTDDEGRWTRQRGCPRKTWSDGFMEDIKSLGLSEDIRFKINRINQEGNQLTQALPENGH